MKEEEPDRRDSSADMKEKILFWVTLAGFGVSVAGAYWTYASMHDLRELIEIMRHALAS